MCFVVIFIQEVVQGKGVVQGIQEGDPVNLAVAAATGLSVLALTAVLVIKGKNDYVDDDLK